MLFARLFILDYITLSFCGDFPCIPCPDHGNCSSAKLKCSKPFVARRYNCVERDALPDLIQDYLLKAELHLLKNYFQTGNPEITETDLYLQTEADSIVFDGFIHLVQSNNSKVLYWSKSSDRVLGVKIPYAYPLGLFLYIDDHLHIILPLISTVILLLITRPLYKFLTKLKLD